MKLMADEAQCLIEKLGERTIVSSSDPSGDLRAALSELRVLTAAEEELGLLNPHE